MLQRKFTTNNLPAQRKAQFTRHENSLLSQTLCLKKFDKNKIGLKFSRVIKISSRKTACIAHELRLN